MILVEVQVPVLNRRYDFELDEESLVADLTELVAELIREKEGLMPGGEGQGQGRDSLARKKEKYCFYVWEQERILKEDETLEQQGVRNGNILYLI